MSGVSRYGRKHRQVRRHTAKGNGLAGITIPAWAKWLLLLGVSIVVIILVIKGFRKYKMKDEVSIKTPRAHNLGKIFTKGYLPLTVPIVNPTKEKLTLKDTEIRLSCGGQEFASCKLDGDEMTIMPNSTIEHEFQVRITSLEVLKQFVVGSAVTLIDWRKKLNTENENFEIGINVGFELRTKIVLLGILTFSIPPYNDTFKI